VKTYDTKKPLLFYISGNDKDSKSFETKVLTKEEIIFTLVS